jgi:CelD/BcsL family acetyltransferase involved in cellulose biosynthesis
MIKCELVRSENLSKNDENAWIAYRNMHSQFQGSTLGPEFFHEISKVRDDVFVAIYRDGDTPIGFLAHHRRPNNFARPCGAPFCDYCALITPPDTKLNFQEALKLANIKKYRAIGLVDPYNLCPDFGGEKDSAHGQIVCEDKISHDIGKKQRKNVNRLRRHILENFGEIEFIIDDKNRDHFNAMMDLKRAQTRETGIHDFLSPPWVQKLIENLYNAPRDKIHGMLMTMTAGGKPIAWQFGPRFGTHTHPWIFAYNPEFAQYSPGQVFLMDCCEPLCNAGVEYNDLSTGSQKYKENFCNNHIEVRHGTINADGTKSPIKSGKIGNILSRLERRFDQIACLEIDLSRRIEGAAFALLSTTKRLKS